MGFIEFVERHLAARTTPDHQFAQAGGGWPADQRGALEQLERIENLRHARTDIGRSVGDQVIRDAVEVVPGKRGLSP